MRVEDFGWRYPEQIRLGPLPSHQQPDAEGQEVRTLIGPWLSKRAQGACLSRGITLIGSRLCPCRDQLGRQAPVTRGVCKDVGLLQDLIGVLGLGFPNPVMVSAQTACRGHTAEGWPERNVRRQRFFHCAKQSCLASD